jgi:shikimate dehydrogenase
MTHPAPGTRPISGTTRLYAVLGSPVAQVRVPGLANGLFARRGIDAVLVPVDVRPEELGPAMAGLKAIGNLDGLTVTVPHKMEICRYADELSEAAALTGSANALRRNPDGSWLADNFDGAGFVRGLTEQGHALEGATVSLVGVGGAGRAIAAALLLAGVDRLRISDHDAGRLAEVRDRLAARWPDRIDTGRAPHYAGADLMVNATPLGMRPGDPLPFDPAALPEHCVVADIVMKPAETELLRTAAALGRPVQYGRHMLDTQLSLYEEFFGWDGAGRAPERTAAPADLSGQLTGKGTRGSMES